MGHHAGQIEVGSLRHMLKTNTKEIHDIADKAMQSFLFDDKDTTTLPAYRHFLLQLYVLYEAMEGELAKLRDHPVIGGIYFPDELDRLRHLETDLDYYYDGKWREILEQNITEGMRRYVARVHEIAETQPELLVAHSYTRYLGDMSGGQILKKMIKNRYDLKDDSGAAFYSFDNVESIGKLKELYTSRMNSLELSPQQKDDLVEEAKRIFQFNIDVFNQVGARFKSGTYEEGLLSAVVVAGATDGAWDSGAIIKMASITVGMSAVIVALCPWFRGMVFKGLN